MTSDSVNDTTDSGLTIEAATRKGRIVPDHRTLGLLLLTIGIGLFAQYVVLVNNPSLRLYGDQRGYYRIADRANNGEGFWQGGRIRPPLYPLVLCGVYWTADGDIDRMRLIHLALCAASIVGTYYLSRLYLGSGAALACAAAVALYPPFISASVLLLSERLFAPLLLFSLFGMNRFMRTGTVRWAVLCGLLWGLTTLTRAVSLYFFAGALAYIVITARSKLSKATPVAAAALVFAATLAPWTVHNLQSKGVFVPVAEDGAFILWWQGVRVAELGWDQDKFREKMWDRTAPQDRSREAIRFFVGAVKDNPSRFLKDVAGRLRQLWSTAHMPINLIPSGQHRNVDDPWTGLVLNLSQPVHILVLVAGAVGLLFSFLKRKLVLLSLFIVYISALHGLLAGMGRYALGFLPVFIILGVFGISCLAELAVQKWKIRTGE